MYIDYKDGIESMEERDGTSSVYMIQYYNIGFYLFVKTEEEAFRVETLGRYIEGGLRIGLRGICEWCVHQRINYVMKFKYRKDYSIAANCWNFYSYCRFKIQGC